MVVVDVVVVVDEVVEEVAEGDVEVVVVSCYYFIKLVFRNHIL